MNIKFQIDFVLDDINTSFHIERIGMPEMEWCFNFHMEEMNCTCSMEDRNSLPKYLEKERN